MPLVHGPSHILTLVRIGLPSASHVSSYTPACQGFEVFHTSVFHRVAQCKARVLKHLTMADTQRPQRPSGENNSRNAIAIEIDSHVSKKIHRDK